MAIWYMFRVKNPKVSGSGKFLDQDKLHDLLLALRERRRRRAAQYPTSLLQTAREKAPWSRQRMFWTETWQKIPTNHLNRTLHPCWILSTSTITLP